MYYIQHCEHHTAYYICMVFNAKGLTWKFWTVLLARDHCLLQFYVHVLDKEYGIHCQELKTLVLILSDICMVGL